MFALHVHISKLPKHLFYSNIYVLEHDKEKYYIPLWYHELEYNDFMVNIHLDLSSNVIVDNENNIQVYINLQDIENTFDISETSSTDVSCNKINKYSYKVCSRPRYDYGKSAKNHEIISRHDFLMFFFYS